MNPAKSGLVGGIDIGSSSMKWTVYDPGNWKMMQTGSVRYPKGIFLDNSVDVEYVYRLFKKHLDMLRSMNVEWIGLSSMAPVLIFTDSKWAVYSSIPYNSLSGSEYFSELDVFEFSSVTGNPLNVQMFPQKILLMAKKSEKILKKASLIVDLNGYLLSRITGSRQDGPVEDINTALEWGMIDIRRRQWWNEIVDYLNLSEKMPDIVAPEYSRTYRGANICIGTVDTIVSALGSIGMSKEKSFSTSGSTLCAGFVSEKYGKSRRLYNDYYFEDKFLINGCNSQYSTILDWAEELLGMRIDVDKTDLDRKLPIFLPYLSGERCPLFDTRIRGGFYGMSRSTDRSDLAASVVASLAYLAVDMMNALDKEAKTRLKTMVAGGSLTKSNLGSIISDLTGKDYWILDYDPATLGASLIGAKAGNLIDCYPDDLSKYSAKVRRLTGKPENGIHRHHLAGFRDYTRLRDMIIRAGI